MSSETEERKQLRLLIRGYTFLTSDLTHLLLFALT